jgi:hypothetical protein
MLAIGCNSYQHNLPLLLLHLPSSDEFTEVSVESWSQTCQPPRQSITMKLDELEETTSEMTSFEGKHFSFLQFAQ